MKTNPKTVLIAGGAGGVGEGITRAFTAAGYRVIATSRRQDALDLLRNSLPEDQQRLFTGLVVDLSDAAASEAAAETVRQSHGTLHGLVTSLGGWWQGRPVQDVPAGVWDKVIRENLLTHVHAVRAFLPLLDKAANPFYFHINGFSAEEVVPGAAPVAMLAAAQKSMALHMAKENPWLLVKETILGPVNTRQRLSYSNGRPEWYTPEEIGARLVQEAEKPQPGTLLRLMEKQ